MREYLGGSLAVGQGQPTAVMVDFLPLHVVYNTEISEYTSLNTDMHNKADSKYYNKWKITSSCFVQEVIDSLI